MKVYHVETQEDYDDLMIKLENEGCMWASGDKPTSKDYWRVYTDETVIYLGESREGEMTRSDLLEAKYDYSTIPIIKYKAKGVEQMEKVVVPQFVADWYEENKNDYILGVILDKMKRTENEDIVNWRDSCSGSYKNNLGNAQEVIAKMYIYGYEVEEKKYHWRKKKEYMFEFELLELSYLRIHRETKGLMFGAAAESNQYQVLLTETQVRQAVSEEDFNKLEKVEIEQVVN